MIVEHAFAYPGLGSLLVDSILLRDVPVIEAIVLLVSAIYILANLCADIMAIILNPSFADWMKGASWNPLRLPHRVRVGVVQSGEYDACRCPFC